MQAGRFPSIRAAAIAVGAARKHVCCVASAEGYARSILKHLAPPGVRQLITYLEAPDTLPPPPRGLRPPRPPGRAPSPSKTP